MTTKRPWTEDIRISYKCPCGCGRVALSNQQTLGHTFTEADARLFAAAPAMYEALEINADIGAIWPHIHEIPADHPTLVKWLGDAGFYTAPEVRVEQLMEKAIELRNAAIRAANPEAFTDNNNVQASEPAGESK